MCMHCSIVIIKMYEMSWYTFICTALSPCTMLTVALSFVTNLGQFMVVYKSYEAIHSELLVSDVLPSDQMLSHSSNPLQRLLTPFRISSLPGSQCISSGSQSIECRMHLNSWTKIFWSNRLIPIILDPLSLQMLSLSPQLYYCDGGADCSYCKSM